LAIILVLSSGLVVGTGLSVPVPAEETSGGGTSTPVIPVEEENSTATTSGGAGLTFDGVLGTINDSLDTVDDFLGSGSDLVGGLLNGAGDILGGLLGDTGGQISSLFRDVARVINLINRVANSVGKIEGFWRDFYGSVLGVAGEGKECATSPFIVNASPGSPLGFDGIDYDPSSWCFGILNSTEGNGSDDGESGGNGVTIVDREGNVTVADAPVSPAALFVGEPNLESDGGTDARRPKNIPEVMALGARGTAMGIPDPRQLRQVANEVDIQSSDAFETIPPVRTYHSLDSVENTVVRLIGVQPISRAGQEQIADSVGANQQMIVQSAQLAASAGTKKITQDVMKDTAAIAATQATLLGSIATDTATNRLQTGATNLALSNISRQLSEEAKYRRAKIGTLAGQLLIQSFSSDLR
jgi:hypothetical protein